MKRFSIVLLALLMVMACALPILAAPSTQHIYDDAGLLEETEVSDLETSLANDSQRLGVDFWFITKTIDEHVDTTSIVNEYLDKYDHAEGGIVICIDETPDSYYTGVYTWGESLSAMTESEIAQVRDTFNASWNTGTPYYATASVYLPMVEEYVSKYVSVDTTDANLRSTESETVATETSSANTGFVFDVSNLFSSEEEQDLLDKTAALTNKYGVNVVIWAENSNGDDVNALQSYCESLCQDKNLDGETIIFTLDAVDRYAYVWASSENVFSVEANDYILNECKDILSEDDGPDYYRASLRYIECAEKFIAHQFDENDNGEIVANGKAPLTVSQFKHSEKSAFKHVIIALVVGLVVGFIVASVLKGQLKSVAMQTRATEYVKKDSMDVTQSKDMFLYNTMVKTARPKESSSGGISHSSGGGGSHGSGGHF